MEIKREVLPIPETYPEYLNLCELKGVEPKFDADRFRKVTSDVSSIEELLQCNQQELLERLEYPFHVEELTGNRFKDFEVSFKEMGFKIGFSAHRELITAINVTIDFPGKYLLEFFDKNRLTRTDFFDSPNSFSLPEDGVEWNVEDIFLHITYQSEKGIIQTAYLNFADEIRGFTPLKQDVKNFEY